jgi:DEAD/DEAH box helicase domain-containing protein
MTEQASSPDPSEQSLQALLWELQHNRRFSANIASWKTLPAREASFVPMPEHLHPRLCRSLERNGYKALYSHQAEAWEVVQRGGHPMLITETASGKTLAYNLPVLHGLLEEPEACALYMFPTKALTKDQENELSLLLGAFPREPGFPPPHVATYDGDTPRHRRSAIRKNARLLLTNPDMLHVGILPYHTAWQRFFANLRYIVLDESHVYRGVFGSHVANVLRRLKRIVQLYGGSPQFVLTSATIGNPGELGEKLIEEEVSVVAGSGSRRGTKHIVLYNPPVIDAELGLRRSAVQEGVTLTKQLLQAGVQSIVFGRSRRTVELMLTYLRQQSSDVIAQKIRGYRSGYLPKQRRAIEEGLREGEIQAVVTTNALELGIDIGSMDAAVLTGYPGSIAGTWQQAGRAGRQHRESLALLIASASPMDQFMMQHPDYFFESNPEQALIDPDNLLLLLQHLRCAAFELPFSEGEGFGRVHELILREILGYLHEKGELHFAKGEYYWNDKDAPSSQVSLRTASPNRISLQTETNGRLQTIGEIDALSAHWMVHPEAIYLHEAQTFQVTELDLKAEVAQLRPVAVDYYTQAQQSSTVEWLETHQEEEVNGGRKEYGELSITSQVTGYRKIRWHSHETLGTGLVDLPETTLETTGFLLLLHEETVQTLDEEGLWNNNTNDYGPGWRQICTEVRTRDGHRCAVCQIPEQGRAHDVHHKQPFKAFHSREEANRMDNLITLCRSCHVKVERVVMFKSGLGGLAYLIRHLAPFLLMCEQDDIGVHVDAQPSNLCREPALVLFDKIPAGMGLTERLYGLHETWLQHARELIEACPCQEGCPSCVGPGGERGRGSKESTRAIVRLLLAQSPSDTSAG